MAYEPSEQDQRFINKVITRKQIAEDYWSPYFDHLRVLLRDYDMEFKFYRDSQGNVKWPSASRVFSPHAFQMIEIEVPLMVSMLLDHDPPFAAVDDKPGEDPASVKQTELLLVYQLRNRGFKVDMIKAIQQIAKIGHQHLKLKWRLEKEIHSKRVTERFYDIPIGMRVEEEEFIAYDGPDWDNVPFYRLFIDPATPPCELQKAGYIIEEDILLWEDFLSDAENYDYDNVDAVRDQVFSPKDSHSQEEPAAGGTIEKANEDMRDIPQDEYAHQVKIDYYYDREDIIFVATVKGAGSPTILLKREKFLDIHPNGKYPYHGLYERYHMDQGMEASVDTGEDKRTGGYYPKGDLDPIHGVQAAINTTINQSIDAVTQGLRMPMLIMEGAWVDEELLAEGWIEHPIIHVRQMSGHRPRDTFEQIKMINTFGPAAVNQIQMLEQWGTEALGNFESVSGQGDKNIETATAFMQATANSMKRSALKVFIISRGIEEMLTEMSDMNAEKIGPETVFYVTGDPQPYSVDPEQVIRGVAFSIRTIPPYSKALIAKQSLDMMTVMERYYPFANAKRLAEIYAENQEWITDPREIIPKDAPDISYLELRQVNQLQPPIDQGSTNANSDVGAPSGQTRPSPGQPPAI